MPELNGEKVTRIQEAHPELLKKFWDYDMLIVEIPRSVRPDLKYVLFARLNQGAINLNHQELRN